MNYSNYLNAVGVDQRHHAAALASLEESKRLAKSIRRIEHAAPFVMAWLVQHLSWEANRLPAKYQMYDTEPLTHIDINGDLKQWAEGPGGVGVPLLVPLERAPLPRNEQGVELCYYAKGHHSRSKWARWIWLGIRNQAQRAAYDLGPAFDEDIQEWHGTTVGESISVYRMGTHWQITSTKRVWRYFNVRRNVGVKIKNIMGGKLKTIDAAIPVRASVVYTPWSAKRWKN